MPSTFRTDGSRLRQAMIEVGMVPGITTRAISNRVVADPETIRWTLATEQPATVYDWTRDALVEEVLLMDGMLVPDSGQVPLLDCHSRWSCEDQLGSVTDFAAAMNGELAAKDALVRFAADEKSQRTKQKVVDGHLTDGSVGYKVLRSVWIPEATEAIIRGRTFQGPLKVTYEWAIKEFSITPIGADNLAKVRALCAWPTDDRLTKPRQ